MHAAVHVHCLHVHVLKCATNIIESVDSICRDSVDMPISPIQSNSSELPNTDVLSLFRQTTCFASASIRYNT